MTVRDTIVGYKLHYMVAFFACMAAYYKLVWPKDGLNEHHPPIPSGLFTKDELALYDGEPNSKGLYISIMGSVFDVEAGHTHYGPDGSYHIFAAKDASKAFITGDFESSSEADLDDVLALSGRDLLGVNNWQKFYEKTYTFKGYLIGRFYDENGAKTDYHRLVDEKIEEYRAELDRETAEKQSHPPCNVEWNAAQGTRVWCTTKSGGIARGWVGVPRQYFKQGDTNPICVCVPPEQVDQPVFRPYKNCDKLADSCFYKDDADNNSQ